MKNNAPTQQSQDKKNIEAPKMIFLQNLPRENKQNLNPPSPKKQPSQKIVDITDEVAQSSRDAQKANTPKATNSATVTDPKKNPADSKSSNPKSSAENSKSKKASILTLKLFLKNTQR